MTDRSNSHIRSNRAVLAQAERHALEWIARRLPVAITPDLLSAFGLFSMACAGLAFASFQWANRAAAAGVVAALIGNWLGDSLDGTVARVRGIERPRYGYYVDHVSDLAGAAFLFTGIAYSGLMTPLLAVALLSAYLLVSAEMYLATHATSVFRMSFFGIGPTELRLLLVAGAVKAAGGVTVAIGSLGSVKLFDAGAIIAIGGLVAVFIVSAVGNARALYLAEPVQRRSPPGGPEGLHADPSPHDHPSLPSARSEVQPAYRDPGRFQTTAKRGRQAPCSRRVAVYADRVRHNQHGRAVNRQHDTLDDHSHDA
jgi:archaetidylinositol phosphate synthase